MGRSSALDHTGVRGDDDCDVEAIVVGISLLRLRDRPQEASRHRQL